MILKFQMRDGMQFSREPFWLFSFLLRSFSRMMAGLPWG